MRRGWMWGNCCMRSFVSMLTAVAMVVGMVPVRTLAEDDGIVVLEDGGEETDGVVLDSASTSDWDLTKYNTARGSLGFFEYVGAKGAVAELTGQEQFDYFGNGKNLRNASSTQDRWQTIPEFKGEDAVRYITVTQTEPWYTKNENGLWVDKGGPFCYDRQSCYYYTAEGTPVHADGTPYQTRPSTDSMGNPITQYYRDDIKLFIESTNLGADGDATSLENMRASIEWIRVANEYRALWNDYKGYTPSDDGYAAPLSVNDLLMAEAQIATNLIADRGTIEHAGYGQGLENAAWGNGNENPFNGWYDAELDFMNREDKTQTSIISHGYVANTTGHLINLVQPLATVTGFAVSQNGTGQWPTVYTQRIAGRASRKATVSTIERYSSARGETPSYDVDEYYNLFMSYYNSVKAAEAASSGSSYTPFETDISKATISAFDMTYTGQPRTPYPTVTLNGMKLVKERDYTLSYENNTNVGTATVTVIGKGSYSGSKSANFAVLPIDLAGATITTSDQTYTGGALKPPVSVTFNGKTLSSGTDYTLTYTNNVNVGTATVKVTGKGNYAGTISRTFRIKPISIEGASVTAETQWYTGGALRPDVTVKLGGKTLVCNTDYYVYSYANNVNVGTASVTVYGKGNYTGTATGGFTIKERPKVDISGATVTAAEQAYTGSALKPAVTVKLGGKTLVSGTDYTVAYASNTNVGTATITVAGAGGYVGTATGSFTISPASVAGATVTAADQTFTGSALKPAVTVKLGSKTLVSGTDYTVAYANNKNAGTASVTVTGKGNYAGTATGSFAINPASIAGATVTAADQTFTGSALKPAVTVKLGSKALVNGTDYTAAYANNKNAGTASVTVTGKGNYAGTATGSFTISPASINGAAVTADDQTYTGSALKPAVTVKLGGKTLVSGTDYTVAYANNKNAGTGTATITGKGNYAGAATGSFTISPASIIGAAVTADDQVYTGVALRPTATVKLGGKTLVAGTDYTVAYSNNTNVGTATVTITGKGNYTGKATGTFAITAKPKVDISGATVSTTDQTYTGNALKPAVTVKLGSKTLVNGSDYTVAYASNTNAGTATATVTGAGDYTGTATGSFTIKPASIAAATVAATDQVYTGSALKPAVTVKLGGKTLASGTDYTVAYSNNTNVGTATVTATGKGNYTGKATGTFAITAKPKVDISGATVVVADQAYTGVALRPKVSLTLNGRTVPADGYTVAYANNTNAGTATITVTGAGDYTGTATGAFAISPASIAAATVTAADQAYTGVALRPTPMVKLAGKTLVEGTDYTVSYANNVNVGTATVTATGKGNYTGKATGTFAITAKPKIDISGATVVVADQTYTGSPIRPKVSLTLDGRTVPADGYTVAYASNTNAGTATVTATGAGDYTGTATGTFAIGPASIAAAAVTAADQAYTGSALRPAVTVRLGGRTLASGTDYAVAYSNNTDVGTATVTVTGRGNYAGRATGSFLVCPPQGFFVDADPMDRANHGFEVDWLGRTGISTGWAVAAGREYRGMEDVARCDFAAFLYRMADMLDDGRRNDSSRLSGARVKAVVATLRDCDPGTPHVAEVAWLVDSGISRGWANGDGTVSFRPMAKVTRQDMAAFLYRFADLRDDNSLNGSLAKGGQAVAFSDVRHGDETNHAGEVEWLASVGVTRGWEMADGTCQFRGTSTVRRQDMAAFMYRLYAYLT